MSYKTYITDAFVCGCYNNLTSDRSYLLFTREAGMLYASAKSVREERSKHRYALQEFSHTRITLVRGKSGWKIIGTEALTNFYTNAETRDARAFFRNIFMLLWRVIHGETTHESIFDDITIVATMLATHSPQKLETIVSFRMLHTLGYVATDTESAMLVEGEITSDIVTHLNDADILLYQGIIERALRESHL